MLFIIIMFLLTMPAVERWHCQGFPHQSKAPRVGAHPPKPPWVQMIWSHQIMNIHQNHLQCSVCFSHQIRQHLTIRNNNTKNQNHANKTYKGGKDLILLHSHPEAPPKRESWHLPGKSWYLWKAACLPCNRTHPQSRSLSPP